MVDNKTLITDILDRMRKEREERQSYFQDQLGYDTQVNLEDGVIQINAQLLYKQQITKEEFDVIAKLHQQKQKYILSMKAIPVTETRKLKFLAQSITEIEFQLQDAWKFKRDVNYHRFWDVPHCLCPKMDNSDAWPTGYYVINSGCPIHGK